MTQARGSIEREASSIEQTAALASFRNAGPGEGPGRHYGVAVIPGSSGEDAGPTTAISPSGGPSGRSRPASTLRRKTSCTIMRRMASESRRSQLLRGVLDLCLLAVMDEGPAYGYEMTKRLRARGLPIVGEGSIYPLLGRLERDGLVETYRAASNGGPPRKYYRPSSAGRLALALGVSEWRAARDAVDAVLAPIKIEVIS